MASYGNFQNDREKNKNSYNMFKRAKSHKKTETRSEKFMNGIDIWTSFYRANPHRFAKDFLNLDLKIFQQILLYMMMHFNFFVYIAARGQGKTYLTAIFVVTMMVLYPKSKIVIAAGQKSQGREIIGKVKEILIDAPLLAKEIKDLKDSANEPYIEMHNGSWLRVVAAAQGSRGSRSSVLVVDEFRMVDDDIIDTVLKKMQSSPRDAGYLRKPEYAHLKERNKQIYLTSAWYKAHSSYDRFVSTVEAMLEGRKYFACSIPYQVSIKENLLDRRQVEDEMNEKTFSEVKWEMEMNAIFWGTNLDSYFKYEETQKNRKLNRVYYPREVSELVNDKKIHLPKKEHGEIRLVSADIATMGGSSNDASAFTVGRLIPSKNGYQKHIIYIETIEGGHTNVQANRIRQLYDDFDCDYIVLDTFNAGIGVYDRLTEHTTDPERGTEYMPFSCINDERLAERCVYSNAPKVIYSIRATTQMNSEIAAMFKDGLRRGNIHLPIHEDDARDVLNTIKGYSSLDAEYQLKFKMPYIQTTLLINEILNLEGELVGSNIKLKETRGMRKDRYSSISYLNYIANELEVKNRKRKTDFDPKKLFMVKKSSLF